MISCIVPVYNNENTIEHVLEVLASCEDIDEFTVVDDASTDSSVQVITSLLPSLPPKVKFLVNERNLGKGGAVVRGIRASAGDVLLLCDADLAKLRREHIQRLIDTYFSGDYAMVIAGQGPGWKYNLNNWISGQRILKRQAVEPYLDLISRSGYGIEQIINFAHRRQRVRLVISRDIGHVLKYQSADKKEALLAYYNELRQLTKTELRLQELRFRERWRRLREQIRL